MLSRLHFRRKAIELEPQTPEEIATEAGVRAAELECVSAGVNVELVEAAIEWELEPEEFLSLITPLPCGMTLGEQIRSLKRGS